MFRLLLLLGIQRTLCGRCAWSVGELNVLSLESSQRRRRDGDNLRQQLPFVQAQQRQLVERLVFKVSRQAVMPVAQFANEQRPVG